MALFGKRKREKAAVSQTASGTKPEATFLGKNLHVKGKITGNGDCIIMGALEGECDLKGSLAVSKPARIQGLVRAGSVLVNGSIRGTVAAVEKVHLDTTARVQGRIHAPRISIVEGARFDGEIRMGEPAREPAAAGDKEAVAGKPGPARSFTEL